MQSGVGDRQVEQGSLGVASADRPQQRLGAGFRDCNLVAWFNRFLAFDGDQKRWTSWREIRIFAPKKYDSLYFTPTLVRFFNGGQEGILIGSGIGMSSSPVTLLYTLHAKRNTWTFHSNLPYEWIALSNFSRWYGARSDGLYVLTATVGGLKSELLRPPFQMNFKHVGIFSSHLLERDGSPYVQNRQTDMTSFCGGP